MQTCEWEDYVGGGSSPRGAKGGSVACSVIVSRLDAGRKRIWRNASCPLRAMAGTPPQGARRSGFRIRRKYTAAPAIPNNTTRPRMSRPVGNPPDELVGVLARPTEPDLGVPESEGRDQRCAPRLHQ